LQRKEAGRLRALRLRRVRHARRYAIRDHEPDPGPRRNYPDRRVMVVMKKFLLATAILAALTGYVSARDDQLPQFYLGKWCMIENAGLVFTREPCHPELELTIRRDGWSSFESTCTFVSVRRTGKFGST